MVYQNVDRFAGKFIKLYNRTFAHTENFFYLFFRTAELYGHFHVYVHDKTDIALLHRTYGLLQRRILNRLNVRNIHARHAGLHTSHIGS